MPVASGVSSYRRVSFALANYVGPKSEIHISYPLCLPLLDVSIA